MKIKIHQMLHGYDQGHNLIQSSIILSSNEDMNCIATLSDWSEYTNPQDEADYITIYPLQNSDYYVISKTWYAAEMKRPGCVWSHSFLVSFHQLSQITDFRVFLDLFVRPKNENFDLYANPLLIDSTLEYEGSLLPNDIAIYSLMTLYNNLVNQKSQVFSIENKSRFYQYFCLLLMNYLPYQALCLLSFSSGSSALRFLYGKPLTLQFVNAQNDSVCSIYRFKEAELNEIPSWIKFAVQEIFYERLRLSRLIHTFAEEIGADSQHLNGILFLLELINKNYETNETKQNAMQLMISILASLFPSQEEGMLMKKRFLQIGMTSKFVADYEFVYYMCVNKSIGSFSVHDIDFWQRFYTIAKNDNRQPYHLLLKKLCQASHLNNIGKIILIESDKYLSLSDLNIIANIDWPLFQSLTSICPKLLNQKCWVSFSHHQLQDVLSIILTPHASCVFTEWKALLFKILDIKVDLSTDFAELIFRKEADATDYVLNYLNESSKNWISESFEKLCQLESLKILVWMESKKALTPNVSLLIMKSIQPISMQVKVNGSYRWIAFSKLSEKLKSIEYYAYLYLLSYNWPADENAIEFMRIAFYPLHKAASKSQLSYDTWKSISSYTEELPIWLDWDRCKKLRMAVVKRVKNSHYDVSYIKNFTPEEQLNKELIKIWRK